MPGNCLRKPISSNFVLDRISIGEILVADSFLGKYSMMGAPRFVHPLHSSPLVGWRTHFSDSFRWLYSLLRRFPSLLKDAVAVACRSVNLLSRPKWYGKVTLRESEGVDTASQRVLKKEVWQYVVKRERDVAASSSIRCPSCQSTNCCRSKRHGGIDLLHRLVEQFPWRCRVCGTRFYLRNRSRLATI